MEIRLSGHSAYRTEYHLVWIPKYRHRILNPGVRAYLSKLFPIVIQELLGVEIVEYNIQEEHIHMVIIIPPKYAVASMVGRMKQFTASELRKKFAWIVRHYRHEPVVWSPGYFVSTVGVDEELIRRYVRYQERQDTGQAKLDL
jgi:putative transposase